MVRQQQGKPKPAAEQPYVAPPARARAEDRRDLLGLESSRRRPVEFPSSGVSLPPNPLDKRLSNYLATAPAGKLKAFVLQLATDMADVALGQRCITLLLKAGRIEAVEDVLIARANADKIAKKGEQAFFFGDDAGSDIARAVLSELVPRLAQDSWARTVAAINKGQFPKEILQRTTSFLEVARTLIERETKMILKTYDPGRCDSVFTFGLMVANLGPAEGRGSMRWLSALVMDAVIVAQNNIAALVRGTAPVLQQVSRDYGDALNRLLNDSAQHPRKLGPEFDFLRELQDQHRRSRMNG